MSSTRPGHFDVTHKSNLDLFINRNGVYLLGKATLLALTLTGLTVTGGQGTHFPAYLQGIILLAGRAAHTGLSSRAAQVFFLEPIDRKIHITVVLF